MMPRSPSALLTCRNAVPGAISNSAPASGTWTGVSRKTRELNAGSDDRQQQDAAEGND